MSSLSLGLPNSLHKQLRELAQREGVSINQFIATALAEKLSALLTLEYLDERGRRGKRSAFDRVLAVPPAAEVGPYEIPPVPHVEQYKESLGAADFPGLQGSVFQQVPVPSYPLILYHTGCL